MLTCSCLRGRISETSPRHRRSAVTGAFLRADRTIRCGTCRQHPPQRWTESLMPAAPRIYRADRPLSSDPKLYGRLPVDAFDDRRLTDGDRCILGALAFFGARRFRASRRPTPRSAALSSRRGALSRARSGGLKNSAGVGGTRDYEKPRAPWVTILMFEYQGPFALESSPPKVPRRTLQVTPVSSHKVTSVSRRNMTRVSPHVLLRGLEFVEREETSSSCLSPLIEEPKMQATSDRTADITAAAARIFDDASARRSPR